MTDPSTAMSPPVGLAMSPAATEEEAAAIVAAYEVLWPTPPVADGIRRPRRDTSWRFGNRWWSLPVAVRRNRPWR